MDKKINTEYSKKVLKVQKEFKGCLNRNCKVVVKNYKTILKKTKNEFKELLLNYNENKIKEKELLFNIIDILKQNINNIKYTNYIKCLIKNCYKNYKNLIDLSYSSLNNPLIQKFIYIKAKEYKIDLEVKKLLTSIKDQSTFKKIKLTSILIIKILEKLYTINETLIIKMIKENKQQLSGMIKYIDSI